MIRKMKVKITVKTQLHLPEWIASIDRSELDRGPRS